MSNKKHKKIPILIFVIIFCVFFVASFWLIQYLSTNPTTFSTENQEFSINEPTTLSTEEEIEQIYGQNEEKQEVIQYEGENPNNLETLTGNISTNRVTNEKYILRISIDQFLLSGTCELKMTQDNQTYQNMANIAPAASSSTCEGFDIPIEQLEKGTWQIELRLSSENKTGIINGEINI